MTRAWIPTAVAVLAVACGTASGGGGGGDNLPSRGAKPWDLTELPVAGGDADETTPFVLAPEDARLAHFVEPAAVPLGGDRVALFFEERPLDGSPGTVLRADTDDGGLTYDAPRPVIDGAGLPDWTGGRLRAPGVVRDGSTWWMAVEYGEGAGIALARDDASGDAFTLDADAALVGADDPTEAGGAGAPALALLDGALVMAYQARSDPDGPWSIHLAFRQADGAWTRGGVALPPGTGCLDPGGDEEACWDAGGASGPDLRIGTTPAGRRIWRLFYTGGSGNRADLGFAASYDGALWSRYPFNPLLDDTGDLGQPTTARLDETYVLWFSERRGASRQGIRHGVHRVGRAGDTF